MKISKNLILLRGCPGSGKTTFAQLIQSLSREVAIFAADDYFTIYNEGEFNPGLLSEAHSWCLKETKAALLDPLTKVVIVHNTFIRKWELKPFLELANSLGVRVTILKVEGNFENIHKVSEEKVNKMKETYEDSVS